MLAKKKEPGEEGGEDGRSPSSASGDRSRRAKEAKVAAEGSVRGIGRPSLGPLLAGFSNRD